MSKPIGITEKTTDEISVTAMPAGCLGTLMCLPGKLPYVLQCGGGQALSLSLPGAPVWPHEERLTALTQSTSVVVEVLGRRYVVCPSRIIPLDPEPEPEPEPEPAPEVPPQYSPKNNDVIAGPETIEKVVTMRRMGDSLIPGRHWQINVMGREPEDYTHYIGQSYQPQVHVGDEIVAIRPKRRLPCGRVPFVDCSTLTHEELCQLMRDMPGAVQLRIRRPKE